RSCGSAFLHSHRPGNKEVTSSSLVYWIVSPPVTRETGGQFPDGETVLVLLFFFCPGLSRRKAKRRASCIGRESNPGLPRGRREFYHGTTNARHVQRLMAENDKPPRTTELLLKGQQRRKVEKSDTTKIELLPKGQQRRMVKKRATPEWSHLSHLIYVPKYFFATHCSALESPLLGDSVGVGMGLLACTGRELFTSKECLAS